MYPLGKCPFCPNLADIIVCGFFFMISDAAIVLFLKSIDEMLGTFYLPKYVFVTAVTYVNIICCIIMAPVSRPNFHLSKFHPVL